MPKMLNDDGVEYDDGTPATEAQQAKVRAGAGRRWHQCWHPCWHQCISAGISASALPALQIAAQPGGPAASQASLHSPPFAHCVVTCLALVDQQG